MAETTPAETTLIDDYGVCCGNCQTQMTQRAIRWFCPSCSAYDKGRGGTQYVGAIFPDQPAHPRFHKALARDPTVAVPCSLFCSTVGETTITCIGPVMEYDSETETYLIRQYDTAPFEAIEHTLTHESLVTHYLDERHATTRLSADDVQLYLV